jgi:hypothetical protein
VKGRKRHIITDTDGHLVGLSVHAADIQDRDGALSVIALMRRLYPWLRHLFADGAFAGDKLRDALSQLGRRPGHGHEWHFQACPGDGGPRYVPQKFLSLLAQLSLFSWGCTAAQHIMVQWVRHAQWFDLDDRI